MSAIVGKAMEKSQLELFPQILKRFTILHDNTASFQEYRCAVFYTRQFLDILIKKVKGDNSIAPLLQIHVSGNVPIS